MNRQDACRAHVVAVNRLIGIQRDPLGAVTRALAWAGHDDAVRRAMELYDKADRAEAAASMTRARYYRVWADRMALAR